MSVEVVLLAPVLVVLVLFVVHLGRLGTTQLRLATVADQAARAASLVHPRNMAAVGRSAATDGGVVEELSCERFEVDVVSGNDTDPRTVTVTVVCEVDRQGLGLLAPLPRVVSASSTEVIDRWRVD